MAKFRITGPDGASYEITAPDNATEQEILDYVQRNAGMVKAPEMKPSTPPPISPRQAEDQSMAAYEKYKDSPEALIQSLPKPLRKAKEALRDSVTGIGQGLTFNFGDEVQAAMATPLEMLRQGSLDVGKAYDSALNNARGEQRLAEMRSPIANTIGQVAGGMAAGGTAQKGGLTLLDAAKPTMKSMVARGAGEGAAYGGLYGLGAGEGVDDRLAKGGLGVLTGGATGGLVGGYGARTAQKAADATIPSTQQLKTAANQAYKAADQAGLEIAPQSFSNAVDDIAITMRSEGIDKTIHPKALAALTRLTEAQGGKPTLGEVDTLRRVVKAVGASPDASERRLANIMTQKLDDWVNNLKPSDVVAGDALRATSALNKARNLWGQMRKSEMIEDAVTRATNQAASTGSGGNVDNAIRQNIRSILDSKTKSRGFTQEELDMMRKVVRGGPVQNLARLVGKLSPSGNGLMMVLHGGGIVASGGATAPIAAVGFGAKNIADAATPKNVEALSRVIRSGGNLPQVQQLTKQQQALLGGLLVNSAQQGRGLLDTIP